MIFFGKKIDLTHCNDAELMQKISKGNAAAFEVLYDRYSALIYRFFYRMLGQNAVLSEDFTQDIFLKIIDKPELFDTNRSFKSWIYAVATNKCKNAFRDKKDVQSIDNQLFTYKEDFDFSIDNKAFETHLLASINDLDLSIKQCFILRYFDNLSIKEIALIVGIPEGTVKSRLHHLIKKLAVELAWCKDILE